MGIYLCGKPIDFHNLQTNLAMRKQRFAIFCAFNKNAKYLVIFLSHLSKAKYDKYQVEIFYLSLNMTKKKLLNMAKILSLRDFIKQNRGNLVSFFCHC